MKRPPSAIIFDMDDTLVATAILWRRAETELLAAVGRPWSAELAAHYKGMNALDVAATIHRLLCPPIGVEACQKIMRDGLFRAFEEGPLRAMPGAPACVARARRVAPLALASGSPLPLIERTLTALGMRDDFAILISSESVPRGKPHPDVFLAAAQALKTAPHDCLVFEDSLVGVRAAQAAGIASFAVPSSPWEKNHGAETRIFASLDEVTREDLLTALRP